VRIKAKGIEERRGGRREGQEGGELVPSQSVFLLPQILPLPLLTMNQVRVALYLLMVLAKMS
jgi:hypothetical protein